MKIIIVSFVILFAIFGNVMAQECGPSCPVCSGSTDGSLLAPRSVFLSALSIPDGEDENGVINLRFGIFSRLDAGIGYGVNAEKALWSARFQALTEDEDSWRPGIILGTGSVRTGKSDQSLYLHLSKSWEFSEAFALRLTAGVASLIPEYNKLYGLGSVSTFIAEKYSPFVTYDGINFHEGIAWVPLDWLTVSVLMIESKEPAVSLGFKYRFGPDNEDDH